MHKAAPRNNKRYHDTYVPILATLAAGALNHRRRRGDQTVRVGSIDVLQIQGADVLLRIRRPNVYERFYGDITFRAQKRGTEDQEPSELEKVMGGWARFYLYGYGREDGADPVVDKWVMIDLDVFRSWARAKLDLGWPLDMIGRQGRWIDDSTEWRIFPIADIPGVVHAAKNVWAGQQEQLPL